jgi:hypothetical protein
MDPVMKRRKKPLFYKRGVRGDYSIKRLVGFEIDKCENGVKATNILRTQRIAKAVC